MLSTLIIISIILYVLSIIAKGVSLYSILLIIPTGMFCARKLGWNAKLSLIIGVELFMLFFSCVWNGIFNHIEWIRVLLCLVCRGIFWGVCLYDDTAFVYIEEERKRE